MATVLFAGDAFGVADVQTATVTAYDAATTYSVTINGKSVSVLGSGGTVDTVATALRAALVASTIPEFDEITWTGATDKVIGTASDTTHTGKTHTLATSESGGTGTIGDFAATTAPKGPEGWTAENVINSSTRARALPSNGDTVVFSQFSGDLKWNLDASTAATTLVVNFLASYTGLVGLDYINEDGTIDYNEYRTREFTTDGGTYTIGAGEGDGSGMIILNTKASATVLTLLKSDAADSDHHHAVVWRGTEATNVVTAMSGSLDVAPFPGHTATIATLTCGGDSEVRTSAGTAITNCYVDDASEAEIGASGTITLLRIRGNAEAIIVTAQTITTATLDGETPTLTLKPPAAMTITTLNAYDGATIDLDDSPASVTITTLNVYGPITINDRQGKLIITNAVARYDLITWNTTPGRAVTYSNP
jgi:hypothetical protein